MFESGIERLTASAIEDIEQRAMDKQQQLLATVLVSMLALACTRDKLSEGRLANDTPSKQTTAPGFDQAGTPVESPTAAATVTNSPNSPGNSSVHTCAGGRGGPDGWALTVELEGEVVGNLIAASWSGTASGVSESTVLSIVLMDGSGDPLGGYQLKGKAEGVAVLGLGSSTPLTTGKRRWFLLATRRDGSLGTTRASITTSTRGARLACSIRSAGICRSARFRRTDERSWCSTSREIAVMRSTKSKVPTSMVGSRGRCPRSRSFAAIVQHGDDRSPHASPLR